MAGTVLLEPAFATKLHPTAPFHFDATVHKPSHFPMPTSHYEDGYYWQTMRFRRCRLGVKMERRGSVDKPAIALSLYAERPFPSDEAADVVQELSWRFDLHGDIADFCQRFTQDDIVGPVIGRWRGMRLSCSETLYEALMIYIVLQNAAVRRTIQMMNALLERYGTPIHFDGRELYALWQPETLAAVDEAELRALKVGYRARYLKGISQAFATGAVDEEALRRMGKEEAKAQLLQLPGVGPASVWYLLFEVFHHYDAFDYVSPWEQKIFSRLLFGRELVPTSDILAKARRRWGCWRMLAVHYLFEDLFWRRRTQSVDWLEELIRL